MVKKKITLTIVGCVGILVLVGLIMAQVINKQNKIELPMNKTLQEQQNTPRPQATPPQKEEATLIQEDLISEKTKKHSKLFKESGYKYVTNGKKLRDLAKEREGNIDMSTSIGEVILPNNFTIDEYLRDLSCKADAIVIGVITGKSSQITEEGTFTFTEYQVNTDEILKNNSTDLININDKITVLRSGGAVILNGKTITMTDYAESPLERNGKYLLFLKFIPETKAYKSLRETFADTSFRLNGEQIKQVSDQPFPLGAGRSAETSNFLTKARSAGSYECNNQGENK